MEKRFIPLSVPNFNGRELEYVTNAVESEWVSTGGKYIEDFETDIASYLKMPEAVACQSGTAALHLSLRLADVQSDDEVIVPTLTFIAAVNPVKYLHAEPVFMDCDDSLTIDVIKLQSFIDTQCDFVNGKLINKISKRHIKAIVIVHVFGNLADMEEIMKIAKAYNIKVIEDATEALGSYYETGEYKGKFAGTIGDFGAYSFNGNKIITTGGGGMLVSTNNDLLKKAKYLSTQAKDDVLYYIHNDIGYNYRMTNLQAALGKAQLQQLEDFIKTKEKNYEAYKKGIENIKGLSILPFNKNIRSNKWFYSLFIADDFKYSRDELLKHLNEKGVQTRPIWGLINEQQPYKESFAYNIEKAKYYIDRILSIPCSSNLSDDDVQYVLSILKELSE
ncbi:LegC family aminotransferase [Clostridium cellulovorans]|uniref:DegT/DnrJ/EryC1/StrS aminotransferase n=1 Tax=Clostridium cellulovorans (strain ATCC 35296 / DSM 3052 / OCM 3 / 743B) TaxID=573061 RepID=D9SPX0_CLOC7|nr:LegC family aminotransferase [Clostridium cellulovorans]ADL52106.1 DegT/DnrJ/EryC1/StrS aminotransferase [Clostridium cellulovorans 743B]